MLLGKPIPGFKSQLYAKFQLFADVHPGRQQMMPPRGRLILRSKLLASAQPTYIHLGNKQADEISLLSPLPLFFK